MFLVAGPSELYDLDSLICLRYPGMDLLLSMITMEEGGGGLISCLHCQALLDVVLFGWTASLQSRVFFLGLVFTLKSCACIFVFWLNISLVY